MCHPSGIYVKNIRRVSSETAYLGFSCSDRHDCNADQQDQHHSWGRRHDAAFGDAASKEGDNANRQPSPPFVSIIQEKGTFSAN